MSNRSLDHKLLDMLRQMQREIAALKGQRDAVRRNDVRIGQMVVTSEPGKNALVLTNLNDQSTAYLGVPEPAVFSYSGALTVTSTSADYAPPHIVDKDCVAIEAILNLREAASTDTVINVWFNNGQDLKIVTLPANETTAVLGVNIPVGRNKTVYPQVVTAGTGAENLAVHIRFGYPRTETRSVDEDR